jgi:cell division protein FtsB
MITGGTSDTGMNDFIEELQGRIEELEAERARLTAEVARLRDELARQGRAAGGAKGGECAKGSE